MLLQAENLSRHYGAREVVHNLSLTLERGQVLGLLGPNGAGKSTTLQMLAGVLSPHAGRVVVEGYDLRTQGENGRACIGFLPDMPPLYRDMTVDEYLLFAAQLRGVPRKQRAEACAEVKKRCDLAGVGRRLIGALSAGYRQRVGLAQALVHQPPLVLLDEPTVGLDPMQLHAIREVIAEVRQHAGVILSSHVLSEVQAMCDHVLIMRQGAEVYRGALTQSGHFPREYRLVLAVSPTTEQWSGLPEVSVIAAPEQGVVHVRIATPEAVDALVQHAAAQGWRVRELTPLASSLERMFLDVVTGSGEARHVA